MMTGSQTHAEHDSILRSRKKSWSAMVTCLTQVGVYALCTKPFFVFFVFSSRCKHAFSRLFRREAFNMDSLERTIDFTYYEKYSERALRVLYESRRRAGEKEKTDRERPRLSPRSYRLRLSDDLVKPVMTDWRARVAALPPIWKHSVKKPFYVQQPSVPSLKDYPNNKHRIAKEMRWDERINKISAFLSE